MMSWLTQDKEAMQKFLCESILQLCRINIGTPGRYEVDGIICITRVGSDNIDQNIDEDQIVIKVHEPITTNVRDSVCQSYPDISILRRYLASQNVLSRLRNSAHTNPLPNLKRRSNDENDNAVIDIGYENGGDKNLVTRAKKLRSDNRKLSIGAIQNNDQAQTRRPLSHTRAVKISTAQSFADDDRGGDRSTSYSCGSCLLDFDSWGSLQGHFQQSHASPLEHYCCSCAVGFLSNSDLGKHNSSVHKQMSSSAVVCSRRKQNKPRRGVVNSEISGLGDNTEDEVETEFGLQAVEHNGEDHQENDANVSDQLQKRPLTKMLRDVNVTFTKQEKPADLVSNNSGTDADSEHICPHCACFFTDFSSFSVHCQAVHHRFPCPHCRQTFAQRVNRDRHLYNHADLRPYDCSSCGDGFMHEEVLRKHQLKCSLNTMENVRKEHVHDTAISWSDGDDSMEDANSSDHCGLDLSMPSRTLKEEPEEIRSGIDEDSLVSKPSIPQSFMHTHLPGAIVRDSSFPAISGFPLSDTVDPPAVVSHLPMTEGRCYTCDICRASIVSAAAFELHCRSEHRRTPCVYCGKTFSQKGNMERHQRQHTGERPFACPHCSCSYTRKETLKVHINQAHPAVISTEAAPTHKDAAVVAK